MTDSASPQAETTPEPQTETTHSQDVLAQAEELFSDTAKFVFDHYDTDKDGLLSRKDFFTFLWELKAPPQTRLTEGQMMSCWKAVDEAQHGSINYEEFIKGVEICYERLFFAIENGVRPPEPVHIPPADHPSQRELISDEPDPNTYNTVRFKKSVAVNFFETLLQEEQSERELRLAEEAEKRKKPATLSSSSSSTNITTTRREREREHVPAPVAPAPAPAAVAKDAPMGRPLTSTAILAKQQQEREAKRIEAQRQMEKILAERHRAERERREAERQAKLEAERQRAEAEAYQAEPSWKVALRNRATAK